MKRSYPSIPRTILIALFFLLIFWLGCEKSSNEPDIDESILEEIDFDSLFAAPTQTEIDQIIAQWDSRSIPTTSYEIADSFDYTTASPAPKIYIIKDQTLGFDHYGTIILPAEAHPHSLPAIIYCHGGDDGLDLYQAIQVQTTLSGTEIQYGVIAPSFRSETLIYGETSYLSTGTPSPWDRDIDDTFSLMKIAFERFAAFDSSRIAMIGISRGGGVALLMGIRDSRIDQVVDIFGPTDFFSEWVEDIVKDALIGITIDLPGFDYLNSTYIQPFKAGSVTIPELRLEMLRRSPVYFPEQIPRLQIHHGTNDQIVPVTQSERLVEVLEDIGRTSPDLEYHYYENAGHDQNTVMSALTRISIFLSQLHMSRIIS